jgi:hypothetical protein
VFGNSSRLSMLITEEFDDSTRLDSNLLTKTATQPEGGDMLVLSVDLFPSLLLLSKIICGVKFFLFLCQKQPAKTVVSYFLV